MRVGGIEVKGPNEEILVLPRGEATIVFRAQAVMDWDTFNALCPEPHPPGKLVKGAWIPDPSDPSFRTIQAVYEDRRLAYLIIKSLELSQIEWDSVSLDDPNTWTNYLTDFRKADISGVEIQLIINCVMRANSLDENKLEEARKVFLLGLTQERNITNGPQTEAVNS
jgi:hypothetical protein